MIIMIIIIVEYLASRTLREDLTARDGLGAEAEAAA